MHIRGRTKRKLSRRYSLLEKSRLRRAVAKFDAIQNAPNYPHGFYHPANFGGAMRQHILSGGTLQKWGERSTSQVLAFNNFLVKLGRKPFKANELKALYEKMERQLKKQRNTPSSKETILLKSALEKFDAIQEVTMRLQVAENSIMETGGSMLEYAQANKSFAEWEKAHSTTIRVYSAFLKQYTNKKPFTRKEFKAYYERLVANLKKKDKQ